ncbi:MAG: M23 family metallopeptidase [Pseudomonadota bacterium]
MKTSVLSIAAALSACAATTDIADVEPAVPVAAAPAARAAPLPSSAISPAAPPSAPATPVAVRAFEAEREDLAKKAQFSEAMAQVEERQRIFQDDDPSLSLDGRFAQGGVVFGRIEPGSSVRLDGREVMVGADGRFVIGFGRDAAASSLLTVTRSGGEVIRKALEIEDRDFRIERIDGLDQSRVSGFTEAQLKKIGEDSAKKKAARASTQRDAFWAAGFDWPLTGRISGVFGSQRILNGEPKRPHSGVDVARPTGTPIRAPADGVITLAEEGMYFEGGLVLLDHGHWLESAFLHMSRIDVAPGQRVNKGDVIGAVGATGRVTGPHLHWSVKWAGELVDPQLLVGEMPTSAAP